MSNQNDDNSQDNYVQCVNNTQPADLGPTGPPPLPLKLSDEDKVVLDSMKNKRELSLAIAERELAKSEAADLSYKYVVLQLYMKYGLTEQDAINENGDILYGGGKKRQK